jgi:hypothetical protein
MGAQAFLDWEEPERVAQAVMKMNLKHAVITSVNRMSAGWRRTDLCHGHPAHPPIITRMFG